MAEEETKEIERPTDEPLRIIRLKDKRENPVEKEPCAKRALKKIKSYFSSKERAIPAKELIESVKEAFGKKGYHLLIPDTKYRTIGLDAMRKLLKKTEVDQLPYKVPFHDCDDYAQALSGILTKLTWTQGYAIGELWFYHKKKNYGHAINLFHDGGKLRCIEPQTDEIYKPKDYMKAHMIKF